MVGTEELTIVVTMVLKLFLLSALCLLQSTLSQLDQCQVFYGGMVFPDGRQSMEHGIHLSKTQSKQLGLSCIVLGYN